MAQSAAKGNGHRTLASARKTFVALALFSMMVTASVTGVASAGHTSGSEAAGARIASAALVDSGQHEVASIIMAWPSKYTGLGY